MPDDITLIRAGQSLLGNTRDEVMGWVSPTYGIKLPALAFTTSWRTSQSLGHHLHLAFCKGRITMHILLIHQAFAALDEPGGTRHIEIARVLADKGHQVTIITSPVSYLTGKSRGGATQWKSVEQVEPTNSNSACLHLSCLTPQFFPPRPQLF